MNTNNITKIQREVLEAAARRNDLAAWPIRGGKLNIGSATRTIKELIRKGLVVEKPAIAKAPIWREGGDGRPLMAVVSDEGLAAIEMLPVGKKARPAGSSGNKGAFTADKAAAAGVSDKEPRMPRAGSKLAMLVALLKRGGGATIEEMVAGTGWRAHSVRGVISGALVKKFGLQITSEKVGGRDRIYRARAPSRV